MDALLGHIFASICANSALALANGGLFNFAPRPCHFEVTARHSRTNPFNLGQALGEGRQDIISG